MADIEVVIKIDEDIYNRFTHNEARPRFEITEEERFQMDADAVRLTRAFCNGTPLPKGHGDLIDITNIDVVELEDSNHIIRHVKGDEVDVYISAPIIIKADKAESEDKK